jgi:hypothetical protein
MNTKPNKMDKANLPLYYNLTHQFLMEIDCDTIANAPCDYNAIVTEIEKLLGSIICAMQSASAHAVPRKKHNFFKQWWDSELEDAKSRSICAHRGGL